MRLSMRLLTMLRYDLLFQFRHGFYYAYGIVCLLYLVLFHFLPQPIRGDAVTLSVFTDTSVLGFFFVGGIILLERTQGVHNWLHITPLSVHGMVVSKTLSLTVLAFLASSVLYFGGGAVPPFFGYTVCGILGGAILFTLLGIALATRVRTINGFFLLSLPMSLLAVAPVLSYFSIVAPGISLITPAGGALLLLNAGFQGLQQTTPLLIGAALVAQGLWIGGSYLLAYRWMAAYLSRVEGGLR